MSPKKLTEQSKKEILQLYRQTDATTSTLAERFEVSSSTVSRFLKMSLSEVEYEDLIQQKRLARPRRGSVMAVAEVSNSPVQQKEIEFVEIKPVSPPPPILVVNRPPQVNPTPVVVTSPLPEEEEGEEEMDVAAIREMFGEDLADIDDDLDEEDDWEDEGEEEEREVEFSAIYGRSLSATSQLRVLPLTSANFPKVCYLVIDRSAELITRPLKDFSDVGRIPVDEIQQRTLPIFDSHRVARRFSKRRERVIKVPDGRMIQKTSAHLKSKGITRLFLDGQIYSLSF
jgi:transposase-like protein